MCSQSVVVALRLRCACRETVHTICKSSLMGHLGELENYHHRVRVRDSNGSLVVFDASLLVSEWHFTWTRHSASVKLLPIPNIWGWSSKFNISLGSMYVSCTFRCGCPFGESVVCRCGWKLHFIPAPLSHGSPCPKPSQLVQQLDESPSGLLRDLGSQFANSVKSGVMHREAVLDCSRGGCLALVHSHRAPKVGHGKAHGVMVLEAIAAPNDGCESVV